MNGYNVLYNNTELKVYSEFATININIDDQKITLAEALENKLITIDDIIDKMSYDSEKSNDSMIYKYDIEKGKFSNKNFRIKKCEVKDGVRKIVIGGTVDFINC